MYDNELNRVTKKLNRLCKKGFFENKQIYIFGVSENTRQIIEVLRKNGVIPKNIIDNDLSKVGGYCSKIKVISAESIGVKKTDNVIFIIYSLYWREMYSQLCSLGYADKNLLQLYPKPKNIAVNIYEGIIGKRIYDKLTLDKKFSKVFLCPYTGTGDIYLIGTFWKQYCQINNIDDYIFVVITGACAKVAKMFNIKNIIVLPQKKQSEYLIKAYKLFPEMVDLKILNDSWGEVHTNPIQWFRGYKGLHFTEMFKKYVFDLPDEVPPQHPEFKNADEEITEIFQENNLQYNKTVVLSPYSNTLADLPDELWIEVADILKQKGFVVCTNCNGKTELPIKGTNAVFFNLDIAPQFIEKAGYFIGVRSGFCDVISGSTAKKIILYAPKNKFYMASAFGYFSLKEMGLSSDVIEIQFDLQNKKRNFTHILDIFKEGNGNG